MIIQKNKFILVALLVFLISFCLHAQKNIAKFERISLEQGLSQSTILCISQDTKGFMWFGTYNGLNRYDGYEFQIYKFEMGNPYSLCSNTVEFIYEDHRGILWIGTDNGLDQFDRDKERFIHYQYNPNDSNSLSNNRIRWICEDSTGALWIGTYGGGLNQYDRTKDRFIRYQTNPKDPNSISHDFVSCIYTDRSGNLWVATDGGLNRYDQVGNRFVRYRHDPNNPISLSRDNVYRIYEDRSGTLWIGTWGGGLDRFDPKKQQFIHYRNRPDDPNSLSNDVVRSIYEDRSGCLWVGTWGGGLDQFDRKGDQFIHYRMNPNDPNSLTSNSVLSIYEDRSGVIWIGTDFGGLNKWDRRKTRFLHYQNDPNNSNSLSSNTIFSIFETVDRGKKLLWIGTQAGGLNKFNRENNQFMHYQTDSDDPHSLNDNNVRVIIEDRSGTLWIGTNGGLCQFDWKKGVFVRYIPDPDDPYSLSSNDVFSICEDRTGTIWIGTYGGGLNRFDRKEGKFFHYLPDSQNPYSLSDNIVWSIYEDRSGVLWIGTENGGLNQFDRDRDQFVHYQVDHKNPNSLSNNKILCIYEDRSGMLWLGTTNGLNQFDRINKRFIHYLEADGFPNSTIQSILEDDHGNLWIGTLKGLTKFDPQTKKCKNYKVSDGLQSNEFSVNACFKGQSGEMFFGGINGFNSFFPDSIKDNSYIPSIVITDFQVFNKSVTVGKEINGRLILKKSITETQEIQLSYRENIFSFEFASLHYASPEDNQYAYMLEGFEKDWNYPAKIRRYASYTNLNQGKYIFRVKGSNNSGVWNEEGMSLKITITPPFWETWWFRIAVGILVFASIWGIHKIRVRGIEVRKRELEIQVEDRTHELKEKNALLEQSNIKLEQVQEMLQKANIALKRSNSELEDFAYVASHDLQEPLRMVSSYVGLLERRYKEKLDSDAREFIHFAVDGAKRMQQLINDLLSYARVGTQGKPFEPTDTEEIMGRVLMSLKMTIEDNGGKVTHDKLPTVMADGIQIERLMQNLVGNGLKYRGERAPEMHVSAKRENQEWVFSVRDNGIGIAPEYYEKIFGIFQRLHTREEYSGTGIGLAVCKKIVERHGGRIWVESEVGRGSTFCFTIPVIG